MRNPNIIPINPPGVFFAFRSYSPGFEALYVLSIFWPMVIFSLSYLNLGLSTCLRDRLRILSFSIPYFRPQLTKVRIIDPLSYQSLQLYSCFNFIYFNYLIKPKLFYSLPAVLVKLKLLNTRIHCEVFNNRLSLPLVDFDISRSLVDPVG